MSKCYCSHEEVEHIFYHDYCIIEECMCGRYEEREDEVEA